MDYPLKTLHGKFQIQKTGKTAMPKAYHGGEKNNMERIKQEKNKRIPFITVKKHRSKEKNEVKKKIIQAQ